MHCRVSQNKVKKVGDPKPEYTRGRKKHLARYTKLTTAPSYIIIFNFLFPFSIVRSYSSSSFESPDEEEVDENDSISDEWEVSDAEKRREVS